MKLFVQFADGLFNEFCAVFRKDLTRNRLLVSSLLFVFLFLKNTMDICAVRNSFWSDFVSLLYLKLHEV